MRRSLAPLLAAAALGLLAALAAPLAASAATIGPGDLIKLADDGNPNTDADSAVYFYGADGKRYVFPNSQTYFTWYADFAGVKIVTKDQLAALPIGGNVTYRPGTRLVKITSDPNVYAVEPGGTLRWIQNETIAKTLFGNDWNKRIDDVPDAYFFNYVIGAPLAAAVFPDGSFVKRASDGAVFRIENRNKRKVVSADLLAALRVQDKYVLSAPGDMSDYPDGADIVSAEPTIDDTAQKTSVNLPSVPTFSVRTPAINFIAIGGEATLLEIHLSTIKPLTLKGLKIRIDATTDGGNGSVVGQRAVDDDIGGLIYQNNAQRNLTGIRIEDAHGTQLFSRLEAVLDVAQDQSQTFTFLGAAPIAGATETVLYVRADVNPLLLPGEGYKATLVEDGIGLVDASTGAPVTFQPTVDLAGPTLTTLASSLQVSPSATPGSKTYIRGAKQAMLAGFTFASTAVAPNVVKSISVQCYVNDSGGGAMTPANGSGGTPCKFLVPELSLFDGSGNKLAGPLQVSLEGRVLFSGLNYTIPAGSSAVLQVGGDISSSINLLNGPDYLAFDVTDAAADVSVVDDKGAKVSVTGSNPNGGTSPAFYATVKQRGRIAWTWNGNGGNVVAGREFLLGTLTADVHDDSYALSTLTFTQSGGAAKSLGDLRIEYPTGATPATASVSKSFVGTQAVFTNLPIKLPRDAATAFKVYAKVQPKENGAQEGESIKVLFGANDALQFTSDTDGATYSSGDLGGDFSVGTNTASSAVVRFTDLTVFNDGSPTGTVQRDQSVEVFDFGFITGAEGGARIKKLTFKITPGDVNQAGAQNDSLEQWATINGDFADDDGVADLKQVVPHAPGILLGEGPGASIKYSVGNNGTKDTAPSARISQPGDYALLEYIFDDGNEFSLGAGSTTHFSFSLDTTKFAVGREWPLNVELEGADQFLWSDLTSGAYTPLQGQDAAGLPVGSAMTVSQ